MKNNKDKNVQKKSSKGFNNSTKGKPMTGRQAYDTKANAKRYSIFGSKAGVGSSSKTSPGGAKSSKWNTMTAHSSRGK